MNEKPSFEGQITPEGEKVSFRVMIERQNDANKKLKSDSGKWAALAAARLSKAAIED